MSKQLFWMITKPPCAAFISHNWINHHCRKGGIKFAYSFILVSLKPAHNKNLSALTHTHKFKTFFKGWFQFLQSIAHYINTLHYINVGCRREPTRAGHHLVDPWQASLSHPALSPFSHSFSKTEQWSLRRRLYDGLKQNWKRLNDWITDNLTNKKPLTNCDKGRIETHQWQLESSQRLTWQLNRETTNNIAIYLTNQVNN